jgi:preprotein translocase subunit SecD
MDIIKKPKILFLIILLVIAFFILVSNGLQYGLEFSGGTEFVMTLENQVNDADQMSRITSTIAQRLDWSGLKDIKVNSWEGKFISAQIAVSNPDEIAAIEEILQKQGKFENILDKKIIFTGDNVISVKKDPGSGYGVQGIGENAYKWTMPFMLDSKSANAFAESAFHKCIKLPDGSSECPKTYMFIDRPEDAIILIPYDLYKTEEMVPADPIFANNSTMIKAEEILENTLLPYYIIDELDDEKLSEIKATINENGTRKLIVPKGFDTTLLQDFNLKIVEIGTVEPYPWIWTATGLKSIIWLNESITNQKVATMDGPDYQVYHNLLITGSALTQKEAQDKLDNTYILLGAGSLPVPIEEISKETLSPTLRENFLSTVLWMGIVALLAVTLVIYIRYRNWKFVAPIIFVSAAEVFLILGFASLIKWNLDLAALAGILAAIGTGIDDQIIITDELSKEKDEKEERSLVARIKGAFFIIFATAATTFATMFPIILFGFGLGKLVGFALIIIAGVTIGVFITRPAFAEIVKYLMRR